LSALDRLVGNTLGLTYQGEPAAWVREAIHHHVTNPVWSQPTVDVAYFPFSRDMAFNVQVTDFYARVKVLGHAGEHLDSLEIEAPVGTAFDRWDDFIEEAIAMFTGHLDRIKSEMLGDLDQDGPRKRLGGLDHQKKSIIRIARVCMAGSNSRDGALHRDDDIQKIESEKQHIRKMCALMLIDSPFSPEPKKDGGKS
jgi:hypothetical protein